MKKLKLIYNPFAGNKEFKSNLDICFRIFQEGGYDVHVFRSIEKGDIQNHILEMEPYDAVVVSGGDGTVNLVVNALMQRKDRILLGIIPSGTANDFARFIGLKANDVEGACKAIISHTPQKIDLGEVNGRYFINVCGGGFFTNVSQNINNDFKNALGKMAYYIKGIEQIPNFCPIPLRIGNSKEVIEDSLYFFLILNSAGAGSFEKLAPGASVQDGLFDFVGFRGKPIYELPALFLKVLRGEHIKDSNVIYFKDNHFTIECLREDLKYAETNVDGEAGPMMPVEIHVLPQVLPVFMNIGE